MAKRGFLIMVIMFSAIILQAQEWKVVVGNESPAFVVEGNNKIIKTNDLKGKVVLLNFFATWCPPCRAELPLVQEKIWNKYKNREDFSLLVLAREEGYDKITPFIEANKYTFPIYPDLKRSVFSLFAENSIPRNVVLNRKGEIIYQSIGFTEKEFDKMVDLIDKELKKK